MNASAADQVATEGAEKPPTVLVVEDEVIIRLAIAVYLRDCGYVVLEAASAEEAVTILNAGIPVDVVFTDVNMPGAMDGFGLALWVRTNKPGVEVIITSGVQKIARKAGELCAEIDHPLIAKPYEERMVEQHIRRLIAARAAAER